MELLTTKQELNYGASTLGECHSLRASTNFGFGESWKELVSSTG